MAVESPNKSRIVVFPAALGSFATLTSADLDLRQVGTLILTVVLGNKQGTVTYTPKLQAKLKNGTYVDYWVAAAALSANGTVRYALGRDAIEALTALTEVLTVPVPMEGRFVFTVSSAGDGNEFDTYAEMECHPL